MSEASLYSKTVVTASIWAIFFAYYRSVVKNGSNVGPLHKISMPGEDTVVQVKKFRYFSCVHEIMSVPEWKKHIGSKITLHPVFFIYFKEAGANALKVFNYHKWAERAFFACTVSSLLFFLRSFWETANPKQPIICMHVHVQTKFQNMGVKNVYGGGVPDSHCLQSKAQLVRC